MVEVFKKFPTPFLVKCLHAAGERVCGNMRSLRVYVLIWTDPLTPLRADLRVCDSWDRPAWEISSVSRLSQSDRSVMLLDTGNHRFGQDTEPRISGWDAAYHDTSVALAVPTVDKLRISDRLSSRYDHVRKSDVYHSHGV